MENSRKARKFLLFDKFNTSTSFIEDICYFHLSDPCKCQKNSLGSVKALTNFFEEVRKKDKTNKFNNFQHKVEDKMVLESIKISVSERIKFFEKIKFN